MQGSEEFYLIVYVFFVLALDVFLALQEKHTAGQITVVACLFRKAKKNCCPSGNGYCARGQRLLTVF